MCVHACTHIYIYIYTLHNFPTAKFQGCILMNVKLRGKCLGTGEKMRQKREKLTLFEWAGQLKVDTEFHRKNQVGSWPQARTAASAPFESVHTPCATSAPTPPVLWGLKSSSCWTAAAVNHFLAYHMFTRQKDGSEKTATCLLLAGQNPVPTSSGHFVFFSNLWEWREGMKDWPS